jgi:hypothetical protein
MHFKKIYFSNKSRHVNIIFSYTRCNCFVKPCSMRKVGGNAMVQPKERRHGYTRILIWLAMRYLRDYGWLSSAWS